jgi:ABC-type hemin transport system ATPase subunit
MPSVLSVPEGAARSPLPASARALAVSQLFGVEAQQQRFDLPRIAVDVGPGRIVAFVGSSGSGKTTALRALEDRHATARRLDRVEFPEDIAVIDGVAPRANLAAALELLSLCALGEAPLWLRGFETLSAGEQFRARLARALGAGGCAGVGGERGGAGGLLLIDEFGSGLHRRAARALAFNLRKLATRRGLAVALATVHEDVLGDLQPDTLVRLSGCAAAQVVNRRAQPRRFSLLRRLRIEPGSRRDWDAFSRLHYRGTDELGFVDKVFVLRAGLGGECLGIVVYSHPPAELALRNQATDGAYVGDLKKLNRDVRILRRLVVHPDLHGCGLGQRLVRRTLPQMGTRYVECLAAMGAVNPVFERAGMRRVGVCAPSRTRQRTMAQLAELGADPFGADFETQVCRRPAVRALVAQQVQQWYQATTGTGEQRVARQTPQMLARIFRGLAGLSPVYYLWERE